MEFLFDIVFVRNHLHRSLARVSMKSNFDFPMSTLVGVLIRYPITDLIQEY